MPVKARRSSLTRLSVVGLATATVCLPPLLPSGDRRGVLYFLSLNEVRDPDVRDAVKEGMQKWSQLPFADRQHFLEMHQDRLIRGFMLSAVKSMEEAIDLRLRPRSALDWVHSCKHALGSDIVVSMMGSRIRRTAAIQDNDIDLHAKADGEMKHSQSSTSSRWHKTWKRCHV